METGSSNTYSDAGVINPRGEKGPAWPGETRGELDGKLREFLKNRIESLSLITRDWIDEILNNPNVDLEALYNALVGYITAGSKDERVKRGEEYIKVFEKEVLGKTRLGEAVEETQARVFNELSRALLEYYGLSNPRGAGAGDAGVGRPGVNAPGSSEEKEEEKDWFIEMFRVGAPGSAGAGIEESVGEAATGAGASEGSSKPGEVEHVGGASEEPGRASRVYVKTPELPSKVKVSIDRELYTVYNYELVIHVDSREIHYPLDAPGKMRELMLRLDTAEGRRDALRDILREAGIDEKGVNLDSLRLSTNPIPYLYAYLVNKSFIGLSKTRLSLGEHEVRLYPLMVEDYERLREELGPELSRLGERAFRALEGRRSNSEEPLSLIRDRVMWIETGLPEDLGKDKLKTDYPRAIELWNKLEAHELLKAVYKAMILPWPRGEYLPHLLIIAPTRSGKSGLYYLATGEEPYMNATSVSLVGGYDVISKSIMFGKLHGRDIAIQIESIETDEARSLASYLVEYMRSGKTRRSTMGRDIKCEGTAPLIFTGNPAGEPGKRGLKLQDWLNIGLLRNPEALGSRLLLFYITEAPRLDDIPRDLLDSMRVVWEIARSSYVKRLIARVWRNNEVIEWLRESDARIHIPVSPNESLAPLFKYLSELATHYWRGLKALALQIAIADNLHRLEEISGEELIGEADKNYIFLRDWLVKSIEVAVSDIAQNIYSDINVKARIWPDLLQKAIIAINEYLNSRAINSGRAEIPITELLKILGEKGYIKLGKYPNPYRSYPARLKNYIKRYEKELGEIGVSLAESTSMIVVDVDTFKKLDIEGLIISLGER